MIQLTDEKYGEVVIVDINSGPSESPRATDLVQKRDIYLHPVLQRLYDADLYGIRDLKKGYIEIIKNKNGSLFDEQASQFMLDYGIEKEIINPIENRFDILDL